MKKDLVTSPSSTGSAPTLTAARGNWWPGGWGSPIPLGSAISSALAKMTSASETGRQPDVIDRDHVADRADRKTRP